MLHATITATGDTLSDLLDAINEARLLIEDGYNGGNDRNGQSSFRFDVDGQDDTQEDDA